MPAAPTDTGVLLPLLTHRGERVTRATEVVRGVDGRRLGELALAPELLISQTLLAQRAADPPEPGRRAALLREAAERFRDDDLGGIGPAAHLWAVAEASGHGRRVTASATRAVALAIADAPRRVDRARPAGSAASWREAVAAGGRGVWARRGETVAAVLSGNAPTIQNGWLQALALGYRVAVRPSRREPFTAFRAVAALRAAGFADTDVTYLPTGHDAAATLLRRADLGLVYGGDDVVARYAGTSTVKVAGPGRSRTLVDRDVVDDALLDELADAVSDLSGTGCVNTTGLLVRGDHLALATRLADELRARAVAREHEDDHLGPRASAEAAASLRRALETSDASIRPLIPLSEVVRPRADGSAAVGPAVFAVDDPRHPALGRELPFPCVWVAPWSPDDGIEVLSGSLVVNAITHDPGLVDRLLRDPSIRNVHVGAPTTHSDPDLPHEGFVGDFLMRNAAVVGAAQRHRGVGRDAADG